MSEELAILTGYQAARIGDEPERVSPLARSFPGRADQRPVAREDEAEGDVALICASIKRIVDRK